MPVEVVENKFLKILDMGLLNARDAHWQNGVFEGRQSKGLGPLGYGLSIHDTYAIARTCRSAAVSVPLNDAFRTNFKKNWLAEQIFEDVFEVPKNNLDAAYRWMDTIGRAGINEVAIYNTIADFHNYGKTRKPITSSQFRRQCTLIFLIQLTARNDLMRQSNNIVDWLAGMYEVPIDVYRDYALRAASEWVSVANSVIDDGFRMAWTGIATYAWASALATGCTPVGLLGLLGSPYVYGLVKETSGITFSDFCYKSIGICANYLPVQRLITNINHTEAFKDTIIYQGIVFEKFELPNRLPAPQNENLERLKFVYERPVESTRDVGLKFIETARNFPSQLAENAGRKVADFICKWVS